MRLYVLPISGDMIDLDDVRGCEYLPATPPDRIITTGFPPRVRVDLAGGQMRLIECDATDAAIGVRDAIIKAVMGGERTPAIT